MDNIGHSPSQTGGKFYTGDKGYLTYEWASPEVFAIMHTVVEEAFRGQGVAKALRRPPQYNDILTDSI